MNAYSAPGVILGAEHMEVDKADTLPILSDFTVWIVGGWGVLLNFQNMKKLNDWKCVGPSPRIANSLLYFKWV